MLSNKTYTASFLSAVIFSKLLFLRSGILVLISSVRSLNLCVFASSRSAASRQPAARDEITWTHLFGAAFKHDILLALVQPPLPHGPEVKHSVFPLQQLIQDVWFRKMK